MKKLNLILLWDDYYIEGYALFLMLLGCFHLWVFIVFAMYVYWQRRIIKIPILLIGAFLLLLMFYVFESEKAPEYIHGNAKIVDLKPYEYSDLVIVKYQKIKYQSFIESGTYQLGDYVEIDAVVKPFRGQTIPYGFNQRTYYLSHDIKGYLEVSSINLISHAYSIYAIRHQLSQYISKFESQAYIKALLLGEKSFTEDQSQTYRDLGILYLFTVSGLHIYTLILIFKKIFFYFSLSEKKQFYLIVFIYVIILYLNAFSMSVLRIVMIFLLDAFFKKMKIELSRLDIIHIAFFLLLIINIEWIYHLGFLMLFIILNFIYLMSHVLSKYKGYMKRLSFSIVIMFSILPFQQYISPFLIFLLPVIMVFITGPIYLLSIFVLFIPEIDQLLMFLIELFESMMRVIEQKNYSIALPALPSFFIFLYYGLIIFVFRSQNYLSLIKRVTTIICLFSIFIFDTQMTKDIHLYMIDVGQGDSVLIESPWCNLVIDSYQNVLPLINHLGIYDLDMLILTHSDSDHVMEAQSIIDHVNVKQVIINPYNTYAIRHKKILEMKSDDSIKCGNIELNFYGPIRSYENSNNNSLVFKIRLGNHSFLFTGDIEKEAEDDLINQYRYQLRSDIIKIPHHGSSTSSSEAFINWVDPQIALISLDQNNSFGFPDQEVINRLMIKQVNIYRTDQMGTICYTYHQKKEKWSFYLPF